MQPAAHHEESRNSVPGWHKRPGMERQGQPERGLMGRRAMFKLLITLLAAWGLYMYAGQSHDTMWVQPAIIGAGFVTLMIFTLYQDA
jgi:hypothetical protein